MRRSLMTAITLGGWLGRPAPGPRRPRPRPVGFVEFLEGTVLAGFEASWTTGTVSSEDRYHALAVHGLSVTEATIKRAGGTGRSLRPGEASRSVRPLHGRDGRRAESGPTIVAGNAQGVVIEITSFTRGVSLTVAPSGIWLTLEPQPAPAGRGGPGYRSP